MQRIFLMLLVALISFKSYGQETWSLQKCIEYALENNIQIKQGELGKDQAEVNLYGSRYAWVPNLNGGISGSVSTGRSINPFTNTIIDQDITSQNFSLNSNMPLFNGLQNYNAIKRDEQALVAATYDLEDTKNNVTLNVVNFYTNILFNKELLNAAQLRLQNTESQLKRIQKQVELGALPRANFLQIKQQKAADELEVVRAENNLNFSKLNLKQALQLPAGTAFEIETPELNDPAQDMVLENVQSIFDYAEKNQPVVKAAEARVEQNLRAIKVAKASYYPSLSLNGGLSTAYSSQAPDSLPVAGAENQTIPVPIGYFPTNNGQQTVFRNQMVPLEYRTNTYTNQLDINQRRFLSLNLNIPIFNRFQVKNNVARAEIAKENAEYQATNVRNQLRQTIEQAYQDVKAASKAYFASLNSVDAAKESYENTRQQFELGAIDAVQFTQTKNDYESAKSDLIRAKYDFIFKQKVLDFYQGKPLNF